VTVPSGHLVANKRKGSGGARPTLPDWNPPGIIQAQVLGVGHIIVTSGFSVIAELNGGLLVEDAVDVFKGLIIRKKLAAGFDRRVSRISATVKKGEYVFDREDRSYAMQIWIGTICRILLRARAFGHGGAFLVADSDYDDRLKTKYGLCYDRRELKVSGRFFSPCTVHLAFADALGCFLSNISIALGLHRYSRGLCKPLKVERVRISE